MTPTHIAFFGGPADGEFRAIEPHLSAVEMVEETVDLLDARPLKHSSVADLYHYTTHTYNVIHIPVVYIEDDGPLDPHRRFIMGLPEIDPAWYRCATHSLAVTRRVIATMNWLLNLTSYFGPTVERAAGEERRMWKAIS